MVLLIACTFKFYENIGCVKEDIIFDTKTGFALMVFCEAIILFTTFCQFVSLAIEYRNESNKMLYELIY
jgi:hypothetical protein